MKKVNRYDEYQFVLPSQRRAKRLNIIYSIIFSAYGIVLLIWLVLFVYLTST